MALRGSYVCLMGSQAFKLCISATSRYFPLFVNSYSETTLDINLTAFEYSGYYMQLKLC